MPNNGSNFSFLSFLRLKNKFIWMPRTKLGCKDSTWREGHLSRVRMLEPNHPKNNSRKVNIHQVSRINYTNIRHVNIPKDFRVQNEVEKDIFSPQSVKGIHCLLIALNLLNRSHILRNLCQIVWCTFMLSHPSAVEGEIITHTQIGP